MKGIQWILDKSSYFWEKSKDFWNDAIVFTSKDDKYILLEGSTAVINNRPSATKGVIKIKNNLESKGIIKTNKTNTLYVFKEDYIFNSPSVAASVIVGGEGNGRELWKFKNMSLNQIEEMEVESVKE